MSGSCCTEFTYAEAKRKACNRDPCKPPHHHKSFYYDGWNSSCVGPRCELKIEVKVLDPDCEATPEPGPNCTWNCVKQTYGDLSQQKLPWGDGQAEVF